MTSPAAALRRGPVAGAIRFADADFLAIARRVHADFGLNLSINKKDMVYSRLNRRLRDLGLHDFECYLLFLDGPDGAQEYLQLRSALTTNVTHFFRESHHFRMLRETVLPPLITLARSGGRVRIWSAGCSAGQEPYSLAFTILNICPEAPRLDIRILATDVDPMVIAKARAGIYPLEEIKAIPQSMRSQLTDRSAVSGDTFAIGQTARTLIQFAELNLMDEWPMRGPIDIIFCRNVAIYFDLETQARLWNRFGKLIPNGGFLFIGHSERLSGPATAYLATVGINTYCRTAETPGNPARHLREELLK